MDQIIGNVNKLGADAFPSVTDLVQLLVLGSDRDPYQPSAICKKLKKGELVRFFKPSSLPWCAQTDSKDRGPRGKF